MARCKKEKNNALFAGSPFFIDLVPATAASRLTLPGILRFVSCTAPVNLWMDPVPVIHNRNRAIADPGRSFGAVVNTAASRSGRSGYVRNDEQSIHRVVHNGGPGFLLSGSWKGVEGGDKPGIKNPKPRESLIMVPFLRVFSLGRLVDDRLTGCLEPLSRVPSKGHESPKFRDLVQAHQGQSCGPEHIAGHGPQ